MQCLFLLFTCNEYIILHQDYDLCFIFRDGTSRTATFQSWLQQGHNAFCTGTCAWNASHFQFGSLLSMSLIQFHSWLQQGHIFSIWWPRKEEKAWNAFCTGTCAWNASHFLFGNLFSESDPHKCSKFIFIAS